MSLLKPCAPDYERHSELSKQHLCQRGLPCFPRLSGKMSRGISRSFPVIFYTGADSSERNTANSYTQPDRWMDGLTEELDRAAGLNCQQVLRRRHTPDPWGAATSLFWQKKRSVFIKSLKNESKYKGEDDKITPRRSLSQLLPSNISHPSARRRFID